MRGMLTGVLCAAVLSTAALAARSSTTAATGGGHYFINTLNLEMQFGFSAIRHDNGDASGSFHHRGVLGGLSIDFEGRITCLSVDEINRRAWIGGVIVKNDSENPSFQTAVHQVGHDIWFRVVDLGHGQSGELDRSTFIGFEGAIPSSANYCETMPWPANNERTWAVTGNITIH